MLVNISRFSLKILLEMPSLGEAFFTFKSSSFADTLLGVSHI